MEPFMFSFVHNFEKIVGQAITSRLRELKTIEEMPIACLLYTSPSPRDS